MLFSKLKQLASTSFANCCLNKGVAYGQMFLGVAQPYDTADCFQCCHFLEIYFKREKFCSERVPN